MKYLHKSTALPITQQPVFVKPVVEAKREPAAQPVYVIAKNRRLDEFHGSRPKTTRVPNIVGLPR